MHASELDLARLSSMLLSRPPTLAQPNELLPDWAPLVPFDQPPVPAAVLIALVDRPEGATVLYTRRSASLRAHSGQVAFPGGKIDPADRDAADAALREAEEEIALHRIDADILGYMPTYFTGTNYLITPVVAHVRPSSPFIPNPREVDAVFEVPFERLRDPASFSRLTVTRGKDRHETWQIDHEGHRIWGITANLTRRLHDLLTSGEAA